MSQCPSFKTVNLRSEIEWILRGRLQLVVTNQIHSAKCFMSHVIIPQLMMNPKRNNNWYCIVLLPDIRYVINWHLSDKHLFYNIISLSKTIMLLLNKRNQFSISDTFI